MDDYELKARLMETGVPEWVREEVARLIADLDECRAELTNYITEAVDQECSTREGGVYTRAGIQSSETPGPMNWQFPAMEEGEG